MGYLEVLAKNSQKQPSSQRKGGRQGLGIGGITLYSKALGERFIVLGDTGKIFVCFERGGLYTQEEIELLEGIPQGTLKLVHKFKRELQVEIRRGEYAYYDRGP